VLLHLFRELLSKQTTPPLVTACSKVSSVWGTTTGCSSRSSRALPVHEDDAETTDSSFEQEEDAEEEEDSSSDEEVAGAPPSSSSPSCSSADESRAASDCSPAAGLSSPPFPSRPYYG
jgi:hypothetical protein